MAVDFDAHIKYFSYNNVEGDDFAVGYLSTKQEWIDRINQWQSNDGFATRFTVEDFEELEIDDLRGVMLAVVEPIGDDHLVSWFDNEDESSIIITAKNEFVWEQNQRNSTAIPQWLKRLKNTIREQKNQ